MSAEVLIRSVEALSSDQDRLVESLGPVGNKLGEDGCYFGIVTGQNADNVNLLLHDTEDPDNFRRIPLRPSGTDLDHVATHQHFGVNVPGVKAGALYTYEVSGRNVFAMGEIDRQIPPFDLYNGNSHLLDPNAHAVHQIGEKFYGVVTDDNFDWGDDKCPDHEDRVICELHAKGATQLLESIPEYIRGTYAGLASDEFIAHLKEVGFTHVELLPVFQFNPKKEVLGNTVKNYWGYDPITFMAPHAQYAADTSPGGPLNEFKQMVKKLHENGIGVILDVVLNHTGEGGIGGAPISFKGIDNDGYYMYDRHSNPIDTNGCGTNFDASTESGQEAVIGALEYWAKEMRVDGLRFDLAPVLARERRYEGRIDVQNFGRIPTIERINASPILKDTILIAEPWDWQGYIEGRLGHFAGTGRWQEWNGFARDEIRRIIRDEGTVRRLANVLLGWDGMAEGSVHFMTAHDGFTGFDLVSYNEKHNEANGEGNRDGTDANFSYNHGVEGETSDPDVLNNRLRALRHGLSILLASNATIMILGGDELLRTQKGNNNAYSQDSPLTWYPWGEINDMRRKHQAYVSADVHFRTSQPQFAGQHAPRMLYSAAGKGERGDFQWLNIDGAPMEDSEWDHLRAIGLFRSGEGLGSRVDDVLVYHNISPHTVEVSLPKDRRFKGLYSMVIDSASGVGFRDPKQEPILTDKFVLDRGSTVKLRRRNT